MQSLAISQPSAEMEIGETLLLRATISPSNASCAEMIWTSTKPKVASVSESGVVSALSEGSTIITVMAGGKTAACSVDVVRGFVAITSLALNKDVLEMYEGDSETLIASVLPDDATDKTVVWTSSDEKVATVKDGVISAVSPGNSTITAKAGDKTAICQVYVHKKIIIVDSITLDKTELSLLVDESATLTAIIKPDDATDKSIIWSSSNEAVATVSSSGEVLAISVGKAIVTVSTIDGNRTASCIVEVKERLDSITIIAAGGKNEITIGEVLQLKVEVIPDDIPDIEIGWMSSDASIASVNNDGLVTAKSRGSVIITVTVNNGSETKSASFEIIVLKPVTMVTVTPSTLELFEGEEVDIDRDLTINVEPSDADYDSFGYGVSAVGIISVSQGKIKGLKVGAVDLYIFPSKANPKGLKAKCKIIVKANAEDIPVSSVELSETSLSLVEGETYVLKATVYPADASEKTVVWKSSNNNVASISSTGMISALKAGNTTITASCGGKTSTCSVTVKPKTVSVTGVSLNMTSLSMTVGDTQSLTATVYPSNATDKNVTWASSNTSVVKVSSSGVVSAVSVGTAVVTVRTSDGGYSATCAVNVIDSSTKQEWVDLGLSVKWATCNLGASKPEEYGDYYAWGETNPKTDYSWGTYKWANGRDNKLTKYCVTDLLWDGEGSPDNKTELDLVDDAAHMILGGKWRMPTNAEWTELREKCQWEWTNQNGVDGMKVTGPNGNIIFLAPSGFKTPDIHWLGVFGFYWSSTLKTGVNSHSARCITFNKSSVYWNDYARFAGLPIRPVYAD